VAGGAIAKQLLATKGISIQAYVSQVGKIRLEKPYTALNLDLAEDNIVRCPDPDLAEVMIAHIDQVRMDRDTIGGIVSCVIKNCPPGLGEPVFDRLHADLGKAMLSINAVKGFEYGSGFEGVTLRGSQHNDAFVQQEGKIQTLTNHSGGIQGGISNGEDIYFRVAFKPVATLMQDQASVNTAGEAVIVSGKGRHDPCVVPRAVPIVEAMAALVIADFLLLSKSNKLEAL
jgi:chorismate synthase